MTALSRADLASASRIVVKVGSSSISGEASWRIPMIVQALSSAHRRGTEVILVSSGAIATGIPFLSLDARPTDLATQQAAAAVGQNVLVFRYQEALRPFGIVAGQVLLTTGDLENRTSRSNAQRAMDRLLSLRIMPIVNENDTVATQEIRFGDNDRLAALVAQLVSADALVLLSDVESLYTKPPTDPQAQPIDVIAADSDLAGLEFGASVVNSVGTGGAATKVSAARMAASSGIGVLVTSADLVGKALEGAPIGTWFEPILSA
ncbi:glutamate 5-kinase [Microbacterium esteraromaticum]|uniref:Glutamate 5-kinase n=1 Tax=Microbacterium esteraromaticum TaxID=57043 RepID=A0A939DW47_9MICO|nr:glutamate 5-kinase [Microbacterium esteraromaticum]MBN7792241.1 glutamate 5-kinase [Microbacterium esteraromaticum]MBN8206381.1 glutamate 5-kinase [Microbacterium esteraromaticum]MBN8416536.1 glutamate 5-kinase [Microbacterium esteraromaticum]MBN8423069.1 glutamate 5-kinase [Microbacterium esteraromaticum]MCA1306553.1 glutamate 5-kinase [Microbacterium esteraromaticum]